MSESMTRQKMREQPPEIRKRNFKEVALGFDGETAKIEAARCLNCKNARCVSGCPVGMNIPAFIDLIKRGDTAAAFLEIQKNNGLPGICGRVCPQEEQCERLCVRNNPNAGGAVSIGALERYAADFAAENRIEDTAVTQKNKFRVAVVGSGPAGLTVAGELAANGCAVTVFEAFHKPGGVLAYGIPEFRLPKALVQSETDALARLGVSIRTNVIIGKTISLEDLSAEYDAIFIGTGAGLPLFLSIPGENLNGVYSANEFLTRVNLMRAYEKDAATPVFVGKKVAVVGAGNVAMDAARTALRMGAEVCIVYRRSRAEMPARLDEIRHAEEEGVVFRFLTAPTEILGEGGYVSGMKCMKMRLGEPDRKGRKRPIPIEGGEYVLECDEVIVALGTSPNPIIRLSTDIIKFNPNGTIAVDENFRTSKARIYAAGDAVTGAATVILAMGNGKAAARAIIGDLENAAPRV
ncbi:MAG: NADPH-dependent glutamate synthase [Clostridiales bacterium]|jgi:glutamate synthase (NADPH/NADH) small chain|nr:NADPH-dependent glutamate synthase [Clostridiales bacterium]